MRSPFVGREILEAQLDVLQPGGGEGLDLARAAQRAGGDEVAVEAEPVAAAISARRSRRAIGSPPEKCTCSTPSAAASREHAAPVLLAESSPAARSRFTGLEQ